jgi:hypothetical protein
MDERGRPSNRKLSAALRDRAPALVQSRYADFGPTLAAEKLQEQHGVVVSIETLRRWMIEAELWVPRSQRTRRVHQPRHRRSCFGELIQIDGCDHEWFEQRAPRCTLLVYVDDATSRLMELRFVKSESTFGYFEATRSYLERHAKLAVIRFGLVVAVSRPRRTRQDNQEEPQHEPAAPTWAPMSHVAPPSLLDRLSRHPT